MKHSIPILLIALALVFAGCNGLIPGSGDTPTETVTPVAVPTDEPTSTPVPQLAPGLTGQGVTDAFALRQAHASVLHNTSFTVHGEEVVRFSNGTPYSRFATDAELTTNETRYYVVQNSSRTIFNGSNASIATWVNGERLLERRVRNGDVSYNVPRGPDLNPIPARELVGDFTNKDELYTLFGAVETRVVGETTRNDTTLYEVAAINVTRQDEFTTPGVNRSRNISFRALVSPRGFVRKYRIHYTATLAGRYVPDSLTGKTATVTRTVRYTNLGNTTIERPPWYDDAIANVSTPTPTTISTAVSTTTT